MKLFLKRAAALLLAAAMMAGLCGCRWIVPKKQMYRIDFGGSFPDEKDEYAAGETVRIRIPLATDTDYSFKVDGEYVLPEYSSKGTYLVYEFVMPDHDVRVEFSSRNSMTYVPRAPEDTEGTLLFDYYEAPEAIVGEAFYDEITVNESEGMYFINVYSGSRTEGTTTSHSAYWAPDGLMDRLMRAVRKNSMDKWNDMEGWGITGAIRVVKFRNDDGTYTRVTSEHMPEDGQSAFSEIYSILCEAVAEAEFIR